MKPESNTHIKSYLKDPTGTFNLFLFVFFIYFFYLSNIAGNDLVKLTDEARCMFLLARIYQKTKESEDAAQAFIKARDAQARYNFC